jgi:sec-independent protein translocase protein TatB
MLPSLGFQEIVLLGVLALVVIGPKDLPLMLRKLGRWTAKLRGMAQEFRTGFDELARQAELDELRREVDALRRTTNLHEIGRELSKPLPTLEDYAGVSKPAAPPAPAVQTAAGETQESASGAASAAQEGASVTPDREDQPVARSAP